MRKGINPNVTAKIYSSFLLKPHQKKYVFPFGKFLRKTGLDEMPQLINVIKGEMSIVGPRPLALQDLENIKKYFPKLYIERENINLLPGITGCWQLNKDESGSIENLVQLDKFYSQHKSFILDLKLFIMSIPITFTAKHKDSILASKENIYPALRVENNNVIGIIDN